MNFCPKCGALLKVKKEKNKKFLACACGYVSKDIAKATIKEEVKSIDNEVDVVENDEEPLPQTDTECPQCGHDKAYYWMVQTRAGDEGDTKFHKCIKCKHVWRDYS